MVFQVARNLLKFGVLTLSVKKCPCFFSRRQKNMHNIAQKSPLTLLFLCPYPNNVGFRSLRRNIVSVFYAIGGGGGGGGRKWGGLWTLKNVFEASFSCLWKKQAFFNTKRVGMPNFSGFQATWKIAAKSVHTPFLDGALRICLAVNLRCSLLNSVNLKAKYNMSR